MQSPTFPAQLIKEIPKKEVDILVSTEIPSTRVTTSFECKNEIIKDNKNAIFG